MLLVIDELPIFLQRILHQSNGEQRVDEFLSWLRGVFQGVSGKSLALIISGSIGLQPLVQRLCLANRINYFYRYRSGSWSRASNIECFHKLAESYDISVVDGVTDAVYDALVIGIPHYVQTFFACLQEIATIHGRDRVTIQDVPQVYRYDLLGPTGQNDLVHYETHLREGLDDEKNLAIAMEIIAEAATQSSFSFETRPFLDKLYSKLLFNVSEKIAEVLVVLERDGYLESGDNGHQFALKLLKDWWEARFHGHHMPFTERDEGY